MKSSHPQTQINSAGQS